MRPVRIRVEHRVEGTVTDHEFVNSPIRIGRNRLNDLPLVYGFVSGWHAVIRFDDDSARFFDLGSTNGTEQDGRRIMPGETVVFDNAVAIQIGDLALTLSRGTAPSQLPVGPTPGGGGPSTGPNSWMRGSETSEAKAGVIDPNAAPVDQRAPRANETAHVPMGQIHASVAALRPLWEEAHASHLRFERAMHEHVSVLPPHLREQAEQYFRREFGDDGRTTTDTGSTSVAHAVTSAGVVGLAELMLPDLQPPATDDEAERFLSAIRDMLEACANSLVELQKGQEQFGREMSVKAIKEFTPLHVAASAQDVLSYLLDWRHGGPHRIQELVGVFADIMIHQVALLNGVVEGARAVLGELEPEELARRTGRGWGKLSARWQAYVTRHQQLYREQRALTEILFGPEFARAYAEVGGEQVSPTRTQPPDPHQ